MSKLHQEIYERLSDTELEVIGKSRNPKGAKFEDLHKQLAIGLQTQGLVTRDGDKWKATQLGREVMKAGELAAKAEKG